MRPERVIEFWFQEIDPKLWFKKDVEFDQKVSDLFSEIYENIKTGKTSEWRKTPEGRLAEIIVLDQFSRNMFRNTASAFQGDTLAFQLAVEAVRVGDDQKIPIEKRAFIYLPFMHSEDKKVHEKAVR